MEGYSIHLLLMSEDTAEQNIIFQMMYSLFEWNRYFRRYNSFSVPAAHHRSLSFSSVTDYISL